MRGEEENSGGGIGAYLAVGDVAEVSERIAEGALVRLERQVADHDAVTRHGGRTFHVRASCVSTSHRRRSRLSVRLGSSLKKHSHIKGGRYFSNFPSLFTRAVVQVSPPP